MFKTFLPLSGGHIKKGLKEIAPFKIGTAIHSGYFADKTLMSALNYNFNSLTPEVGLTWKVVHPFKNTYNFTETDKIVSFATKNGYEVIGHTFCWWMMNPYWLTILNQEDFKAAVYDHALHLAYRYPNISEWMVVNESFNDNYNIWREKIGDNFSYKAFEIFKKANPKAIMYYNDIYEGHTAWEIAVEKLLSSGIVDGLGIQMHIHPWWNNFDKLERFIDKIFDKIKYLRITEADVRIPDNGDSIIFEQHAKYFANIAKLAIKYKSKMQGFATWGVSDKVSWIPEYFPGFGRALLFDKQNNPKNSFYAVYKELDLTTVS